MGNLLTILPFKYRDFCLDPHSKCKAMNLCAKDFNIDWVTVMSDPWTEASAFGLQVEYPEDNLPIDKGGHISDARAASKIKHYDPRENNRCLNRLTEIREFRNSIDNELFVVILKIQITREPVQGFSTSTLRKLCSCNQDQIALQL